MGLRVAEVTSPQAGGTDALCCAGLAIVIRGTWEVILFMVARKEGGRGKEREGRMEGREGGKKTKSTQGSTAFPVPFEGIIPHDQKTSSQILPFKGSHLPVQSQAKSHTTACRFLSLPLLPLLL